MGLFMDEVGKFITESNDRFFPAAAPIIYAFFLLTILIHLHVRKPSPRGARTELYHALDQISELLDSDLQEKELLDTRRCLAQLVEEEEDPALRKLAETLLAYLESPDVRTSPDPSNQVDRWAAAFERLQIHLRPGFGSLCRACH